jgi:hypothetical protein
MQNAGGVAPGAFCITLLAVVNLKVANCDLKIFGSE